MKYEYTGFTQLGTCPICKKELLCYEMQDEEGYCVLICHACSIGFRKEEREEGNYETHR